MRIAIFVGLIVGAAAISSAAEPDWLDQPTLKKPQTQAPRVTEGLTYTPRPGDGPNLLRNGDFEKRRGSQPLNWSDIDRLTTKLHRDGPDGKGWCIAIDTDVYLAEWEKHRKLIADGQAGIQEKTPTTGPKYDTVAGTHGVHLYSDPIYVKKGQHFMLSVAMRGPSTENFYPKVFVKGYRRRRGREEEVYRAPLHCRTSEKNWRLFTWRVPKEPYKYGAQYVKVIIYCYWPPGAYLVDDVRFWQVDPAQYRPRPGPDRPVDLPIPVNEEEQTDADVPVDGRSPNRTEP